MRNPRGRAILAGIAVVAASQSLAGGYGLKPGLWETHIIKMTVDGQDRTGQMAEATSKMQAAMANLPPERRAQMEAMMKQRGMDTAGGGGTARMCFSKEFADSDRPYANTSKDEQCEPAQITHSGNRTTYSVTCTGHGETSTGKGEAIATGDLISAKIDMTSKGADGATHQRHIETEMKFLGADCGDLKPIMPQK
jgi:hypothetical protein